MLNPWLAHYEPGIPPTLEYPALPLHGLLEQTAARYPQRTATIFFGAQLSYRALDAAANRFAHALLSFGLKRGDRVALMLPNCPQFLIAFYGTLKAGGVVTAVNPLYTPRELEHQLNDAGVETLVTLTKFYPTVEAVRAKTALQRVIVTNIKESFPAALRLLFTLFKERKEGHRVRLRGVAATYWLRDVLSAQRTANGPGITVDPGDTALLQYTGGTTGTPKGAMLKHAGLVANTLQIRAWLSDFQDAAETMLLALPLFHIFGMGACMSLMVHGAGTMVLLPQFRTGDVLRAVSKYRATLFPGVPSMYVALNNSPELRRVNLKSLRHCFSGAAPLPQEVQQRFEAHIGGHLVEGFGMTEANACVINPLRGTRKPGSIGIPIPDVEARIVDLATGMQTLPPGEVGELAVRCPQQMQGYWHKPDETAQVLRDGWVYTGDIARMDAEGFFYLVDRKKEMILSGGFNVYPRDVEEVLYMHSQVQEAAVIGTPDAFLGECVKAFVVPRNGVSPAPDEIIEFCRQHLVAYKVPKQVEFRASLPKTLVGKVLRRVLIEEERQRIVSS
ncbi:MAG TPA: long-chain fatty acid--CoA ligase [Candidatus Tectomicrobia bacterium]|jgi:long-chain acyl-CoA synthetase|nr:long-chain fatty acid--CoA ligase [Candidatus Tectomicrobia bacterium]